jgi:Flp pilus assembly protein TadD/ketosteroid isomerase-like protein
MLISAARSATVVRGSVSLFACMLLAFAARADDMQDASRMLKAGQHQQALERVNKVLAAKPRDPQARFLKGLIFTDQGNTKDAIDIFTKLTQDYPELPEPYNNLAVIYAAQGQYDKARVALEQSIRTHPSYATAYENLGDVYAKLASQAYDKALQIDSSNKGAQNKLSLVRELVGGATPAPIVIAQKPAAEAPKPAAEKAKPADKPAAEKPMAEKPVAEKSTTAEKPAGKPAAAKPPADASAEVLAAVNGWAQAWAKRDADRYLSYYAADFKVPGKESRAEWEKSRRARLGSAKTIRVGIGSPKVTMSGSNGASVVFQQNYQSDTFKSSGRKTLVMAKSDGGWKIREEKSN